MKQKIKHIKFDSLKGNALQFDFLRIEDLLRRKILDHSPKELHLVEFFMIVLITEGKGAHTIDFIDYPLQAGDILTIRKDQVHKFIESDLKGYVLLFTDDFVVSYFEKLEAIKTLQIFNELITSPKIQLSELEFKEMVGLVAAMEKEFFNKIDDQTSAIIRSLLHILLSKLYRFKSNENQIIRDKKYIKSFIEFQNLVEQECFKTKKVQDYARKMGVSSKTLNNIVQSILNKSAKTFIDEVVITQIKRLLVNSPLTIKEIAFTAGFEEPTNLYKYFKRYVKSSPEAFRKAH